MQNTITQFIVNLKINSLALFIAYVIIHKIVSSVYVKLAQIAIYRENKSQSASKKESVL